MDPTLTSPPALAPISTVATAVPGPVAAPDFVAVDRILHQRLLWEQSEVLGRIESAREDVAAAFQDAAPAASTSLMLGLILFLAAYCLRPIPCIVLPGRGAFGIPAKRKRKA